MFWFFGEQKKWQINVLGLNLFLFKAKEIEKNSMQSTNGGYWKFKLNSRTIFLSRFFPFVVALENHIKSYWTKKSEIPTTSCLRTYYSALPNIKKIVLFPG